MPLYRYVHREDIFIQRHVKKFVKNADLNKTSHFRVAFLESNCKKLFLVVNNWLIDAEL